MEEASFGYLKADGGIIMSSVLFLNPVPLIKSGVLPAFEQNGWETFLCEGEEFFFWKTPKEQYDILDSCIKKYNPTIAFLDFAAGPNFQKIYQCCKDNKVKLILWGIEDTPSVRYWLDQSILFCDLYLTTTQELIPYAKEKYDKDIFLFTFGTPAIMSDKFPKNADKDEDSHDLVFVGNNYSSRYDDFENFISPLIQQKTDILIYGNDWWLNSKLPVNLCKTPEVYRGYFPYEELGELYSNCKIGLGLNCNKESLTQTSMRPYEVMAVGYAIYVAPYTPAQENLFGPSGKYGFFPKTPKEMLDTVSMLIEMDENERLDIAQMAKKYVFRHHTYNAKVSELIKKIKELL